MLFVSLILLALSNFTLSHFVSWAHNVSHPTNDSIVSFDNLPTAFAGAVHLQNPADVEQIRNTLWLYPLAIDGKNFAALDLVFTQDVVANYSAPLNVLTPLSAVQAALQRSLMPVTTQHKLSTQVVEILPGGCQAKAVTYYDATHFGMGNYTGQIVSAYGQYQDYLVKQPNGQWKIAVRNLVYMGPLIGNLAIFQPS